MCARWLEYGCRIVSICCTIARHVPICRWSANARKRDAFTTRPPRQEFPPTQPPDAETLALVLDGPAGQRSGLGRRAAGFGCVNEAVVSAFESRVQAEQAKRRQRDASIDQVREALILWII